MTGVAELLEQIAQPEALISLLSLVDGIVHFNGAQRMPLLHLG